MGWGPGTSAAHPYPKSWQVNPDPLGGGGGFKINGNMI